MSKAPTSKDKLFVDSIVGGVASNTLIIHDWAARMNGGKSPHFGPLIEAMEGAASSAADGDLGRAESILMSQILALNTLFATLARWANCPESLEQLERCMRLALRAQGQCRATAETLAVMKNPPIFATQANITKGPQQVNNRVTLARAEIHHSAPNKLLEDHNDQLDAIAPGATVTSHSSMEALGPLDGAENRGRQGRHRAQRLQGRPPAGEP